MANWHFKNFDLISSICKNLSEDPSIPDSSRKLFAVTYEQTRVWKNSAQIVTGHHVEQARNLMYQACKPAHLCQCEDVSECKILSCPLVRVTE